MYNDWAKEFGDLIYLEALGQPMLILNSSARTTDLFDKRALNYSDRPHVALTELLDVSWSFGNLDLGPKWRMERGMLTHFFRPAALPRYRPILNEEIKIMLKKVTETPSELLEHIHDYLGTIITRMTYGSETPEKSKQFVIDAERLVQTLTDSASIPGKHYITAFPFLKHVPEWVPGAGFQRTFREHRDLTWKTLKEPFEAVRTRLSKGEQGPYPSMAADLIEKLPEDDDATRANNEATAQNVCGMAYISGVDTTMSSAWAMVFALITHPDVQKKAWEQLNRVVGSSRLPTLEDRPNLPYIAAIVKETSRWHTTAPFSVMRATADDDEYNGYFIPKGTFVIPNTWAIMHDPKVYDAPLDFRPERFLKPESGELDRTAPDPLETGPFGYGRRICPGRFASDDALFLLAACLLYTYELSLPKDQNGTQKAFPNRLECHSQNIAMPLPFECSVALRSQACANLIA